MKTVDKSLDRILNDKTSGSAELVNKLNRYFIPKVMSNKSINYEITLAKKYLSHFAVINNFLNRMEKQLKKNDQSSLLNYLIEYRYSELNVYKNIFNSLPEIIKNSKRILTLSNSKTILEVLKLLYLYNNKIKVIVCESLPECEGRILAKRLIKKGIKAQIIPDSQISRFIEKSDLLLLGCDIILKNGDIINKTGSRNAAVMANYFKKPVVVVSSKAKRINRNSFQIKGRDKKEKYLFERVEKKFINLLVTD